MEDKPQSLADIIETQAVNIAAAHEREFQRQIGRDESKTELTVLRAKVAELEAGKADARIVTVEQLERWMPFLAASEFRAEIRAIIKGVEK